ncbi:MAG: histidinol dehydrogenase [Acidimicrobiales bacterium]
MLNRLDLRRATGDLRSLLPRPVVGVGAPVQAVRAILDDVRGRGDAALLDLTERFDGVRPEPLRVPAIELKAALEAVPAVLREALEVAWGNIVDHHRHQVRADTRTEDRGLVLRELRRPVERAGCYVPGGKARYPSTVLMTAGPATVAGVDEVVVVCPPGRDGHLPVETLAACAVAGVSEVYRVGGAQAVGALAYGTASIPAVDVIVGPGNVYVAVAKREVAGEGLVGVPSAFAGPSEVVVVADATTDPTWAAIDVLVQAEHGPDGLAWLLAWEEEALDAIAAAVDRLLVDQPRRADIEATLGEGGYAVLCRDRAQAMAVANLIAPEHLELLVADPEPLLPLVRHAGAVFTGMYGTASLGDYVAGPSHVLPTYGSARFSSALRVDDFVKTVHVISADPHAFARLAPHVAALADAEGLHAHAQSVRMRGPR